MKTSFVLQGTFALLLLAGCSQGPDESTGVARSSEGSQALSVAQSCQQQAKTCATSATTPAALSACEQQLRACLLALIPDAGIPPIPPIDFDAAVPPVTLPPLPDASIPPIHVPPVVIPDAGSFPGSACIQSLESCLASSTDPATCATQVVTCLQHAI